MPVTAVGFDLDDTLAVPDRKRRKLLTETTNTTDTPSISREAYLDAHQRHQDSDTRTPIFEDLLATHDSDTDPATIATTYRRLVNNALTPIPNAEDLLTTLATDYHIGLLTNGPSKAQRTKLETLGWTTKFDTIKISGEIGVQKPDSQAFTALLTSLNASPETTVYIGNNVHADIKGATQAGIRAIQVIYPDGPRPASEAIAHIDRKNLATTLPTVLTDL